MRGSIFSAICALVLACCGTACNMVRDPEARMESGCGEGGRSALGVLDLRIGMPRAEALRILRCYDGDADLSFGTSGSYANDVSRFLREVNSGRSGYTNLVVWSRGRTRVPGRRQRRLLGSRRDAAPRAAEGPRL